MAHGGLAVPLRDAVDPEAGIEARLQRVQLCGDVPALAHHADDVHRARLALEPHDAGAELVVAYRPVAAVEHGEELAHLGELQIERDEVHLGLRVLGYFSELRQGQHAVTRLVGQGKQGVQLSCVVCFSRLVLSHHHLPIFVRNLQRVLQEQGGNDASDRKDNDPDIYSEKQRVRPVHLIDQAPAIAWPPAAQCDFIERPDRP
mmetsp:Transcript_78923/g.221253  ORF Transcript_78923/g.221253 Transcript_78923/m.221253 type:complete len:203 (-) Transcript_78923:95-703(-)